ncbi:MAG: PD40 domain-containing protein [Myxococcales bacterium]|nr:PD40 domain-containing protein [Myxococcales bacterium]
MKDTDIAGMGEEPEYRPRSKAPLAIALLVVLLGGGGWFAWKAMTTTDPFRVLVAIDFEGQWFEGSKPAARLVDDLNSQLEGLGFDVVRGGDPAVLAVLEDNAGDLLAAARKLKASYLIGGRVAVERVQHEVADGGYTEVRANAGIELQHVDDATPAKMAIQSWSGARDPERALMLLADGVFARKIGAAVVPALVDHPTLAPKLRGDGADKKAMDAKTTAKLRKAEAYVQARGQALSTAAKAYAAFRLRRLEDEKGPRPVSYHGTTAEEDGLIGTGPDGFLVKTADEELYVNPESSQMRRLEAMEGLVWKRPDDQGTVVRPLWTGYNIYSYPGVTADGGVAALVEDLFGWAKTVTLIGRDGKFQRLRVDPKHRYSNLTPSPTGKAVAFYDRECRRCEDTLVVLDAAGKPRFQADREGGRFEGYAWLDDDRLVVMHTPATRLGGEPPVDDEEGEEEEDGGAEAAAAGDAPPTRMFDGVDQTIWLLDIRNSTVVPQSLYVVDEGQSLAWVRASRDGGKVAFSGRNQDGPAIAVLDVEARVMTFIPTPGPTEAPVFSPDGASVAFNVWPRGQGRDAEIGLAAAAGGEVTVLTDNPHDDRYPHFSHDGQRIFFESRGDDPNFPRKRNISFIASVAVAP